jgi:flagellar motor component MotA
MKNLKLTTLILVIISSSLFATTINYNTEEFKQIGSEIPEALEVTKNMVEHGLIMNFLFSFDTLGEIVILNVESKKNISELNDLDENNTKIMIPLQKIKNK